MTLSIHHSDQETRIEINGLLHLWIKGDLVGAHSYMTSDKNYFIEWHTKEKMILSEYDKRWLWEKILKGINKKIQHNG